MLTSLISFLNKRSVAAALLYFIQLHLILAVVSAANLQGLPTKEEASNAFVYPTFLEMRLQHHVYATNFYAYALFLLASHVAPVLLSSRFAKAMT